MSDALTRAEVKANILDRLVSLGWVRLDDKVLRLNSDVDLDQREWKVVGQMINGTEPERKERRCPVCLR